MNPFEPPFQPNPLQDQTSPYIQAILAMLAGNQPPIFAGSPSSIPPRWSSHPLISASPPRHFGPAEGPLGENAHLGWGQTPKTTASPRKAAPTRKTKLGGYVGGLKVSHGDLGTGIIKPGAGSGRSLFPHAEPFRPHYSSPADVIRRLLSGQYHLYG